jgi:hypothetical protein
MGKTLALVIGGQQQDFRRTKKGPAEAGPRMTGRDYLFVSIYTVVTFAACRPLGPWTTSKRTA